MRVSGDRLGLITRRPSGSSPDPLLHHKGLIWFRRLGNDSSAPAARNVLRWPSRATSSANDTIASEAAAGITEIEDFLALQPVAALAHA